MFPTSFCDWGEKGPMFPGLLYDRGTMDLIWEKREIGIY